MKVSKVTCSLYKSSMHEVVSKSEKLIDFLLVTMVKSLQKIYIKKY